MATQQSKPFADFASVLDAVDRERQQRAADWRPVRLRFCAQAALNDLTADHVSISAAPTALLNIFADGFTQILPDTSAEQRLSITCSEAIAREIGLTGDLESSALQHLRRRFAARNHPDLAPAHLRKQAEYRMKIANILIDDAMAQIAASA